MMPIKKMMLPEDYPHYGKNTKLAELYDHLIHKKISFEVFLKRMDGMSQSTFFSPDRYHYSILGNKQRPLKLDFVRQIYVACHIPLISLLLDPEKETPEQKDNKKLFTSAIYNEMKKDIPDHNPLYNLVSIPHETSDNDKLKKAYKRTAKLFREAKNTILIFDLMIKVDNPNKSELTTLAKAQEGIYGKIETCLKGKIRNKEFKYTRVFSLALSNEHFNKTNPAEQKMAFVTEASVDTLQHVQNCLELYPNIAEFYITTAARYRHQCLIDDEWMLFEDYARIDGRILPDAIFVDHLVQNNKINKMKDAFIGHMDKMKTVRIGTDSIELAFNKAANHFQKKIEELKEINISIEKTYGTKTIPNNIKKLVDQNTKQVKQLETIGYALQKKIMILKSKT